MSELRTGVIHDLGYRHYDGPREANAAVTRTLFVTGLRHAYGLGRSGRSKILPLVLLALATLPAAIVVGVVALIGLDQLPMTYAEYTNRTQTLVSLFAAAQAPVLFSRDLRHRSIVLYLARPLSAPVFALTRWLSLTAALLIFTLVPTVVLFAGALLSDMDISDQASDVAKAVTLQLLLAALIAGITGVISSISLRRGFAVVGSVLVLVVGSGIVTILQAIGLEEGLETLGQAAALASPWSLFSGLADAWSAGVDTFTPPTGVWVVAYVAFALLLIAGCVAFLLRRFQAVGAR